MVDQLKAHEALGVGRPFTGRYMTQDQLWGKVQYVCSLNPNRRRFLFGLLRKIDWVSVRSNAEREALTVPRENVRLMNKVTPPARHRHA